MSVEFNNMQRAQIGRFYDILAQLLPTEGRDYTVEFSFGPEGQMYPVFESHTEFGEVWVQHCIKRLHEVWGNDANKPKPATSTVPDQQPVI